MWGQEALQGGACMLVDLDPGIQVQIEHSLEGVKGLVPPWSLQGNGPDVHPCDDVTLRMAALVLGGAILPGLIVNRQRH